MKSTQSNSLKTYFLIWTKLGKMIGWCIPDQHFTIKYTPEQQYTIINLMSLIPYNTVGYHNIMLTSILAALDGCNQINAFLHTLWDIRNWLGISICNHFLVFNQITGNTRLRYWFGRGITGGNSISVMQFPFLHHANTQDRDNLDSDKVIFDYTTPSPKRVA